MAENELDGKVVIITGAAKGQGEAEARLFGAQGAKVVLADLLEAEGHAVAGEIGRNAVFRLHDISDPGSWKRLIEFTLEGLGRLDVLVNNAGISRFCRIEDETLEEFDRIIAVNLRGTFLGIKSAIVPMRANGGGSIVNVSSLASLRPHFAQGAYAASKFGVTGLTKVAAQELGPCGIRVNSVHPGPIDTDMLPGRDDVRRWADLPLGRAGRPSEVADLALFLASDRSSYITGAEFVIDGGSACGRVPREAAGQP